MPPIVVNTLTAITSVLKTLYPDELYNEIGFRKRPLFGMMPKREDFGAQNMVIALKYGNPVARSARFADAQTMSTAASTGDIKAAAFSLTRMNDYSLFAIPGETIEATSGDNYAFVRALDDITQGAMHTLASAIEHFLYRDGTGVLGTVGTYVATESTFILGEPETSTLYEVGMELVFSEGTTGARGDALIDTGNSATVTGINRTTGVLTSDSAWDTQVVGLADDDFVHVLGDAANGSTNVKLSGLEAWFPATAPSSTAFFGVNRTVDTRLSGTIFDGSTGISRQSAMIRGQSLVGREEGSPSIILMHTTQYRALIEELGAAKEYSDVNARGVRGLMANVGYKGVVVHGDAGEMVALSSPKCQAETAWALSPETLVLATLGPPIKWAEHDGQRIRALSDDDSYEGRLLFRGQMGCNAPIYNANIAMPAI